MSYSTVAALLLVAALCFLCLAAISYGARALADKPPRRGPTLPLAVLGLVATAFAVLALITRLEI